MENLNRKDIGEALMEMMDKMMNDMLGEILNDENDYDKTMRLCRLDNIEFMSLSTLMRTIYNRSKTIFGDGRTG